MGVYESSLMCTRACVCVCNKKSQDAVGLSGTRREPESLPRAETLGHATARWRWLRRFSVESCQLFEPTLTRSTSPAASYEADASRSGVKAHAPVCRWLAPCTESWFLFPLFVCLLVETKWYTRTRRHFPIGKSSTLHTNANYWHMHTHTHKHTRWHLHLDVSTAHPVPPLTTWRHLDEIRATERMRELHRSFIYCTSGRGSSFHQSPHVRYRHQHRRSNGLPYDPTSNRTQTHTHTHKYTSARQRDTHFTIELCSRRCSQCDPERERARGRTVVARAAVLLLLLDLNRWLAVCRLLPLLPSLHVEAPVTSSSPRCASRRPA